MGLNGDDVRVIFVVWVGGRSGLSRDAGKSYVLLIAVRRMEIEPLRGPLCVVVSSGDKRSSYPSCTSGIIVHRRVRRFVRVRALQLHRWSGKRFA